MSLLLYPRNLVQVGPRLSMTVASLCFGGGMMLGGLGVEYHRLALTNGISPPATYLDAHLVPPRLITCHSSPTHCLPHGFLAAVKVLSLERSSNLNETDAS